MSFRVVTELDGRYDVIVVGSGAAGLLTACRAADAGLRVVVLEKASLIGGTSSAGGGVLWAPANPLTTNEADSPEAAAAYLAASTEGQMSDDAVANYVKQSAAAVAYLEERTQVRLTPLDRPDYHPELPGAAIGGRSLDNQAFDGGSDLMSRLRPPTYFPLLTMAERDALDGKAPDAQLLADRAASGARTMGGALVGALLATALDRGVDIAVDARMTMLVRLADELWHVGVSDGQRVIVAESVVVATGGYEWNPQLQASFLKHPVVPISAPSNEGDGLRLALAAGASVDVMPTTWGVPVITAHGAEYDGKPSGRMANVEMTLPGSIVVNRQGRRFMNEAMNYHDTSRVLGNLEPTGEGAANLPAYLVVDRRYVDRYPIAGSTVGVPPEWLASAETLAELAERIGVDAEGLVAQVAEFNESAREGVDPVFGRGVNPQDQFLGDATNLPNPCLAPLETGPYYAVELHPGVLGTSGGLRVDADARVLDHFDEPVEGLYAAGNVSASVFRGAYPGGGATLGSALVRAYAAGSHLAASFGSNDPIRLAGDTATTSTERAKDLA